MDNTHVLRDSTLRNFVGPGTELSLLESLFKRQIKIRLMQLAQIQRQLSREASALATETGFYEAYWLLKQLPSPILYRIVGYPSFGQWCATAAYLLSEKEQLTQSGSLLSKHLCLLGNYALAGALANGIQTEITLRLDQQASVPLPTLACAIVAPPEFADAFIRCQVTETLRLTVNNDSLSVCNFDLNQSIPKSENEGSSLRLREAVLLAGRFELNDYDPLLRSRIAQDFETLNKSSQQRWIHLSKLAIDLLQRVHPTYFAEVERYISVIVPLVNTSNITYVSSTTQTMYGLIQLSRPNRESLLAEGLIHEYHHNKLNALMNIDPLIDDPSSEARYYSPWRSDPRPLYGLLHGIFAFQSVAQFWHTYITHQPVLPDADWGSKEYGLRRSQCLVGIELIQQHTKLTQAGEIIVDEIRRQLETLPDPPISSVDRQRIKDQLATHRRQWERENSHLL